MKVPVVLFIVVCVGLFVSGCASTEIYDAPEDQKDDVRNELSYTSTEMRKAAQKVLVKLLDDDDFNEYIEEYKKKNGGKRPFVKIAKLKNETDNPDISDSDMAAVTAELNSFIENTLRKSKKVRITRYEGVERIKEIAASRDLEDDDNVRQDSVAKRGTIEAAKLLIRPHLTSNNVGNGRKKRITRSFIIDVVRIDTGEAIFTCTEQLGFSKTRGVVGW